jgi:EmrB/QacA subfamily drug resistance transporter
VNLTSQAEASDPSRRQILVAFSGLLIAMLLAALDQTIVATALPTIAGDLGGINHISWVVTAYLLASTASTPVWGKIGDLYGRKRLLLAAIVIFLGGSAACGLAHNMAELVGFRALQGVGAGGLMTMATAVVGDLVPPRERGRYQGYIQATFAVASIAGPLVGGTLVDDTSWRWIFYVNLPVGAVALILTGAVLHVPQQRIAHKVDYAGAALLVAGVCCLLLVTVWGGQLYAWGSPQIAGLICGFAVLLLTLLVWERRVPEPILPLTLIATPVIAVASTTFFLVTCCLFATTVFLPLYMQIVQGQSAANAGLLLLPMLLSILLTTTVSGWIVTKTGRYKVFPVAGTFLVIVAMFLFSRLGANSTRLESTLYMVVMGLGFGMVTQVLVVAVQNSVAREQLGTATGTANFFRSLGGAIGVAVFGAVFAARLTHLLPLRLPASVARNVNPAALISSPAQVGHLPASVHTGVVESVAQSVHAVFLTAIPIAAVAFLVVITLREIPLRNWQSAGSPGGPRQPGARPSSVGQSPADQAPPDQAQGNAS